jgi:hypothetical protein
MADLSGRHRDPTQPHRGLTRAIAGQRQCFALVRLRIALVMLMQASTNRTDLDLRPLNQEGLVLMLTR